MIEKHAASQSAALTDLQSELRSLKTLLQSRQAALNAPHSASSASSLPNPPGVIGNATGSNSVNGVNSSNGMSTTQAAANALLTPKGRGIPAWQMAPTSPSSGGSVSGAGSATSSLASSGVLDGQKEEIKEDGA